VKSRSKNAIYTLRHSHVLARAAGAQVAAATKVAGSRHAVSGTFKHALGHAAGTQVAAA
jgi:hypothetical protein